MLSNSSICSTCDKKRVCKHFDYASKNVDLTINIEQCEHNVPVLKKTDINTTPIKPSTPVPTPWTPYDPNNPYKATSRVYGLYPDLNKSDVAGKIALNIPVKISTGRAVSTVKPEYRTSYALIRYIASRPLPTPIQCFAEKYSANSFSKTPTVLFPLTVNSPPLAPSARIEASVAMSSACLPLQETFM